MNQYSTTPEYSVVQSEKMHHTVKAQLCASTVSYQEVEAELRLLYKELTMSVDILGRIRDSVLVLQLSLQEPE